MRALLLTAVVIAIFFAVAFFIATIHARIQRRRAYQAANPMFAYMTRIEKRAYARELREREQEQYELQLQQDLLDVINRREIP